MPERSRRPGRDRIVDAALRVAEREGWENLRLHQVAVEVGGGLDDVRRHFREKDEIIDAWFDRADAAMLHHYDRGGVNGLPPRERIRQLVLVWLEALSPHHHVTREMIAHKLEPGHVHVQFPAILRISRTVQWIREGAMLDAPLPRRALEETAMTALFVKTFLYWLRDDSEDFRDTRRCLDRGLYALESLGRWVPGGRFGGEGQVTTAAHDAEDTRDDHGDTRGDDEPEQDPAR